LDLGTGTVTLGASDTVTVSASVLTVDGIIGDGGNDLGLTKAGAGTLSLTGANTYAGIVTISAGTLRIADFANGGAASGLGESPSVASSLVLNGGTLQYVGSTDTTTNRLFTLGTGTTAGALDSSGIGNITFSNTGSVVNSGTGTRTFTLTGNDTGTNNFDLVLTDQSTNKTSLTKSGTGQWIINTAQTYTGNTTVTAGTLTLGGNNLLASTGNLVVSGGTLAMNGFNNTSGNLILSGGNVSGTTGILTVNSVGTFGLQSGTDSAILAGTGALNKTTSGTVTLNGLDTDTGIVTISAGTLSVTNLAVGGVASGLGQSTSAAANLVLSGGTLQYSGTTITTTDRLFTLGTGSTAGAIDSSGTGNLTLSNTGSIVNSSTGTRTLTLTGTNTGTNNFDLVLTDQSTNKTSLTKSGTGQWIINTTQTYTGNTTVSAGTLVLGASSLLATSGNMVVSGGTLSMGGFNNTFGNLTLSGGNVSGTTGILTVNNVGTFALQSGTDSAILAGTGALNKTTSGTVTLNGLDTDTGIVTVSAGTLSVTNVANGGAASGLGESTSAATNLVLNGGTLQYSGTAVTTTDHLFTLGTSGGTLDSSGIGNLTFSNTGSIVNSGTGTRTLTLTGTNTGTNNFDLVLADQSTNKTSLTKSGTGQWILNDAETYTGTTTVSGGTLQLNNTLASLTYTISGGTLDVSANSQLASAAAVTVSGGTLAMSTFNNTLSSLTLSSGSITGTGTLTSSAAIALQGGSDSAILAGTNGVSKSTAGTVTLSGANTYSGGTTISAGTLLLSSSGTLGSTSNALTLSGGTLDLGGQSGISVATFTLSGGTLTDGALTGTSYAFQSGTETSNAILGGTVALTKTTTGLLTLAGANTYSGGTNINAATINFSALNNFGTGALTFGGGTLQYAIGDTADISSLAVTIGTGGGTIDTDGNNVSFADSIGGGGSGSLTKAGAGSLTLNAAGTYTGGTIVSGGTLLLGNAGALGSSSGALTINGGTLDLGGLSGISVGTLTLAGGTLANGTITGTSYAFQSGTESANAVLAGTSALTKTTAGLLTLAGANTYSGGTNINAGTINFSTLSNFGTGGLNFGGGTLQFATGTTLDLSALTLSFASGSGIFDTNGNNVIFANSVGNGGAGGLTKLGNGTLTLAAVNTYMGTTTVNAGTLLLGSSGTLGNGTSAVTISGGVLDLGGQTDATAGTLTLTSGTLANGTITASSYAFQSGLEAANAVLAGGGALTKTTTGLVTLAGTNTYSGGTNINAGTINFSSLNNFGTGGLAFGGGTLQYASGSTTDISSRTITLASGSGTIDTNGNNVSFANPVGNNGSGGLTKTGLGNLTLSAVNTYTGATTVNLGTLMLNLSTNPTGVVASTSALTLGGGALVVQGNSTGTSAQTLGSVTLAANTTSSIVVNSNGGDATTLTLGNTWTPNSGTVNIDLSAPNTNIVSSPAFTNGILGYATVYDGTNYGFATSDGNGNLVPFTSFDATGLPSSGTLATTNYSTFGDYTMTGTNHSVNSLILDTTFETAGSLALSSSTRVLTITTGGILMTGDAQFVLSTGEFGASGSTVMIHQMSTGQLYVSGTISGGAGTLITDGPGFILLEDSNTYSGGTFVDGGTVSLGGINAAGTGPVTVNGGTLQLNFAGSFGFSSLTLANGTLQYVPTVTTDMSTHTITIGTGGATIDTDVNNVVFANAIGNGGVGGLLKVGSGNLTLSGANTYTGGTQIGGGFLVLNNIAALQNSTLDYNNYGGALSFGTLTSATLGGLQGAQDLALTNTSSAAVAVTIGSSLDTTYSGNLSGTGSLVYNGTGNFSLTGNNIYTGGTTVNAGTVSLGVSNATGTGPVAVTNGILALDFSGTYSFGGLTLAGGTLRFGPGITTDLSTHTITFGVGGGTIDTGANNVVFGNAIGNSGVGGLIKVGAGNLTLSGADTYTGDTQISNGFLVLNNAAALQNSTLDYDSSGGTLSFGTLASATFGGLKGTQNLALTNTNSAAVALTVNGSLNTTYTGNLSDTGSFTDNGTGTVTLGGNNTYSGVTTINDGTLVLTGNTSNLLGGVVDNATLVFNQAATSSVEGLSGNGEVVKSGSGNLTLIGNNYYTGGTSVSSGALVVNGALGGNIGNATQSSGDLYVGGQPDTDLLIDDGASVYASEVSIGNNPEDVDQIIVTDAGSLLSASESLTVGVNGTANLTVANGGNVTAASLTIGNQAGSVGTVLVTGTNSTLSIANTIAVGVSGTGNVTVANGGSVTANGYDAITGAGVTIDGPDGTALVTDAGSTLNVNNGALLVGDNGTGTLTVANGGQVSLNNDDYNDNSLDLGFGTGSGTLIVKNDHSNVTAVYDATIGLAGSGNLTVANGGLVEIEDTLADDVSLTLGNSTGSNGNVTVDGTGLSGNASLLQVDAGAVVVGESGNGNLSITNGGAFVVKGQTNSRIGTIVANMVNSLSSLLVDGDGSRYDSYYTLIVGESGQAISTISGGGEADVDNADANNVALYLGNTSTGNGTLTVTGADSILKLHQGDMVVGQDGMGSVTVDSGGTVDIMNGSLILANDNDSSGTFNLNGGGTLEIGGGGLSSGGGGGGGAILSGGTLLASSNLTSSANFTLGDGTTSTINTNNNQVTVNANISGGVIGNGGLSVVGGGTLVLNGNDTYTGTTSVTSGNLVVNGQQASPIALTGTTAVLGGNGTINNTVTIAAGGAISPGINNAVTLTPVSHGMAGTAAGLSTLTASGAINWDVTATTLAWHLSSSSVAPNASDTLNTGTLTNTGSNSATIIFDFDHTGYFNGTPETYTLITAGNNLSQQFNLSQFQATNVWQNSLAGQQSYFLFAAGGTELQFVLVPEPATWGLIFGGATSRASALHQ